MAKSQVSGGNPNKSAAPPNPLAASSAPLTPEVLCLPKLLPGWGGVERWEEWGDGECCPKVFPHSSETWDLPGRFANTDAWSSGVTFKWSLNSKVLLSKNDT